MSTVLERPATTSGLRTAAAWRFFSSSGNVADAKQRLAIWNAPTGIAMSHESTTTSSRPALFSSRVAAAPEKQPPNAVAQLRDLSGLTAGQLARALGVSRRSIQGWIAGSPMAGIHAERVFLMLRHVQSLDGSAEERRAQLLDSSSGVSVFHAWEQMNSRSAVLRPEPYSVRDLMDI